MTTVRVNRPVGFRTSSCPPAAPSAPHPTTTQVIVELEDLGGRTRMTMIHAGVPEESPSASGWSMAFDELTAYLETQAT